jgi:hypothetical protein
VPWAYGYAFPHLRRANLTGNHSGSTWQDKGSRGQKYFITQMSQSGCRAELVMGFPPRHRFPPNGTPKPRCPPPSPGLHLLKFLGAVKLSCLWSLVNAASPRLSVCDRRKRQPLQRRGKYGPTSLERGSCLRLTLRQMRVARRQQRDQCAQILLESRAVTSVTSRSIVSFGP